jgi:hypothetical protein
MAIIQSGASSDNLTVEATSKAARVIPYDKRGGGVYPRATYSMSAASFTPPASATDIATIFGSGSTVIRILQVVFTITGTATTLNVSLVKRTTANSGGTPVAMTGLPFDSTSAATTATLTNSYTANPTLGSGTIIDTRKMAVIAAAGAALYPQIWDFDFIGGEPIVLRGTSQGLAINLNATSVTSPLATATFIYTEE